MIKSISSLAVVLALLLIPFGQQQAQAETASTSKPVIVISFSGLGEIVKDAEFIAKLGDFQNVAQLKGALDFFAGGLDQSRPWGFVVTLENDKFKPIAFVPVKDLKQLIGSLQFFGSKAEKNDKGIYEIEAGPRNIYVKESEGWAFVSIKPDFLEKLPEKPAGLLGGLNKKYDLAAQVNIENVPQEDVEKAIVFLKTGAQLGLRPSDNESDEAFQGRQKIVQNQVDQLAQAIKDSKNLTVGVSIDREKKNAFFDLDFVAKPDSKLASTLSNHKDVKTEFAGFLMSDATVSMNFTAKIDPKDVGSIEMLRKPLMTKIDQANEIPDEDSKKAVKKIANEMFDICKATLKEGKLDGAGSVVLKPGSLTILAGVKVADGMKVDKILNDVFKMLENEPGFPGVKDAGTYKSVALKTMTIPVDDAKAEKVLGEELTVVFGSGKKSIYFAMGTDAMKSLKAAIDNSGPDKSKSVDIMSIAFGIGSILNFAASVEDDPILATLAKEAENFKGKDRVIFSEKIIKNGVKVRFELEEGVLNIIAKGVAANIKMRNSF